MCLQQLDHCEIPELTAKVAKAAFPDGNMYLTLRDRLDGLYTDGDFATLYPSSRGRPSCSPANLALCLIAQFVENLSDREMARAVRGRIDLKYLLGLELEDAGFDHTVLHRFRARILAGGAEAQLLDKFVAAAAAQGLIKAQGRQRTDATHVLAAVRGVNRLECVGETLRHTLNVLAEMAPAWLQAWCPVAWYTRYGSRFEQYHLPKGKAKRQALAETIGQDGFMLLEACYAADAPPGVREVAAVEILRAVWVQQYLLDKDIVRWRGSGECPPAELLIQSPYDIEAHFSRKKTKNTEWVGYKVHITETCEDDKPLLITHVETTASTTPDVEVTPEIHKALAMKGVLPEEHLVDSGYIDAEELANSQEVNVDLVGPVQPDSSWQARANAGYDLSKFAIDWEAHMATCPQGQASTMWSKSQDRGHPVIHVRFSKVTCQACPSRELCTQATKNGRSLKLLPQAQHLARQQRRQAQETTDFQLRYHRRAGVEGSISQGVRRCGLRTTRYIGQARTHLGHILCALALNVIRLHDWWAGTKRAQTRYSAFATLGAANI